MNKVEQFYRFTKMMFRRFKNLIGNRRYLNMLDGLEIEYIAARGVNKFSVAYMSEWKKSLTEISYEERQNFNLIQAIKFGDIDEIRELVEAGANINNSDSLLYAVLYGDAKQFHFSSWTEKLAWMKMRSTYLRCTRYIPTSASAEGPNTYATYLIKRKCTIHFLVTSNRKLKPQHKSRESSCNLMPEPPPSTYGCFFNVRQVTPLPL